MIKVSVKVNGKTYTDVKQGRNAFRDNIRKKTQDLQKEIIKKAKEKGKQLK
jgi:hypothetical protein